jgi:uroporphyrinogen decarboxylase
MKSMNSRERILATLRGEIPDRVGRSESFWEETLDVWKSQGLGDRDPLDALGLDIGVEWPIVTTLLLPEEIVEETDEYVVKWDGNGVLRKDFKAGGSGHTPHWLEHKLKSGEDWYEYKDRVVLCDDRIKLYGDLQKHERNDRFAALCHLGPYECAWPILGQVNTFTMMMDEPDVLKDMFMTFAELEIAIAEEIRRRGVHFDGMWFFEDLGYGKSTLFSPECYEELLFPAHKKLFGYFRDNNIPVLMHSCGKIESLIPKLIEAGISAIQPLEAKCDQDVVELKALYGDRVTLFGNIDVRSLSGSREDIEEEIKRKLPIAMKGGRYIFHSDHSVPPTVSYENYLYALELVDKYGAY